MCVNFPRTRLRRDSENVSGELLLLVSTWNLVATFISPDPTSQILCLSEETSDSVTGQYFHLIWKLTFLISEFKLSFSHVLLFLDEVPDCQMSWL